MTQDTLDGLLRATVGEFGGRPAIHDIHGTMTWAELDEAVDRRVGALTALGVGRGSALGISLPNSREFIELFLAVGRLGGSAVSVNPALRPEELDNYLAPSEVALVVSRDPGPIAARAKGWPTRPMVIAPDDAAFESRAAKPGTDNSVQPGDRVAIGFSSGSTGWPKRIPKTQGNLAAESLHFKARVGLTPDDTILGVAPFFHAAGLGNVVQASVGSGASMVLLERFERFAALEVLAEHRVTVFPGVPLMFEALARTRRTGDTDLGSLRLLFAGGAPLDRAVVEGFKERTGLMVNQQYGCTEAGSVSIDLGSDPAVPSTYVGRPFDGYELRILEDGGIWFSGPSVTPGYLDGADPDAFWGGGFETGDLGYLDDDGGLHITGRTKLFISTAGFKVDPAEVEGVIERHDMVQEAVVVGVEGRGSEQIVKAVVVQRGEVDRNQIIEHCREQLADFKVPKIVEFIDEIPRSPVGKILRKDLL